MLNSFQSQWVMLFIILNVRNAFNFARCVDILRTLENDGLFELQVEFGLSVGQRRILGSCICSTGRNYGP